MNEFTPTYNLKAVIHETGLTPATLRAWERRYGLLKPQRSAGGHRLYTQAEIDLLKWLVARQAEGLSISQAIELWRGQGLNEKDPAQASGDTRPTALAGGSMLETLRATWINACLGFNEQQAEQTLAQAFAIVAPEVVCAEILQKGLAQIGEHWYGGKASVQQEHFASALAMRRLHTLFSAAPPPSRAGRILAACPPGEMHEFGLLVLSYLLRRRGWDVVYLGMNVPLSELDNSMRSISPRLIVSAAQTLHTAAALREMANFAIQQRVPLAFGGGIFTQIPALAARIPGHYLGDLLDAVPLLIERILAQPPALPLAQDPPPETAALLGEFFASEALILNAVSAEMQAKGLDPQRLEEANASFTRGIISALKLGDIRYMDHAVDWLEGLLQNHAVAPASALDYYSAYSRAIRRHLGPSAAPVLAWLAELPSAA